MRMEDNPNANEESMVLWLSYKEFDALFTGDLEGEGEKKLTEYLRMWKESGGKEENRTLEVLKAGHHGSANGSSEKFLEEIRPFYTVISCGKNNRYGHPAQETLDRLEDVKSRVIRTDICGAVRIRTDGKKVYLSANLSMCHKKERKEILFLKEFNTKTILQKSILYRTEKK